MTADRGGGIVWDAGWWLSGGGRAGTTGFGWRTREASQGGVFGLETAEAEELRGGLGNVGTLELGRTREIQEGNTGTRWEGAGESREERGRNTRVRKILK